MGNQLGPEEFDWYNYPPLGHLWRIPVDLRQDNDGVVTMGDWTLVTWQDFNRRTVHYLCGGLISPDYDALDCPMRCDRCKQREVW